MSGKKRIIHRRTLKKINIALCVLMAVLVATLMFLLMKRKEAISHVGNARQTYEETLAQNSYEGLSRKNEELQQQIDKLNSDISDRTEEINDMNEMLSKAKSQANAAEKFCELAEKYLNLQSEDR